jgi:tetratricopeptide (TPR) repeat protein
MDINKILQLASKYHQKGNLQQTEITYKKLLKFDPYNIYILNYLGNVFQDQHRYNEARDRYQKAIQYDPNFVGSYNNLGNAYRKLGRLDTIKYDFKIHYK